MKYKGKRTFRNVNKSTDIFNLIDRSHVPEINQAFCEVIEEIKNGELRHCLDEFREKIKTHYTALFLEADRQEYATFHWFELTRYREWDWRMTEMLPLPPPDTPHYEILPHDIIEKITEVLVDPDKINSMKDVYSEKLNKLVDVKFVRVSDIFLCGTAAVLHKNHRSGKSKYAEGGITLDGDIDTAYRVFSYYTRKYPQIKEHFFRQFNSKMLPRLIDIDAAGEKKKVQCKIASNKKKKRR